MTTHRLHGLALILGAVCSVLTLFDSESTPFLYISILGVLLFIFGIPAVQVSQPSGSVGLIGMSLLILAAVIALGFRVGIFGCTNFDGALVATSALSGVAGRLIVGWLTVQKRVFAPWIGWAFMVEGLFNLVGFLDLPALINIVTVGVTLAGAAAQIGYGLHIFRETAA